MLAGRSHHTPQPSHQRQGAGQSGHGRADREGRGHAHVPSATDMCLEFLATIGTGTCGGGGRGGRSPHSLSCAPARGGHLQDLQRMLTLAGGRRAALLGRHCSVSGLDRERFSVAWSWGWGRIHVSRG